MVILECPRIPQLEAWARSYEVLRIAPSSVSVVVRDNIAQGVTLEGLEAWKRRYSVNTCSNGASEESIGIYAKSKCQWNDHSIQLEPRPQRYGCLKPQGP